MRFSAAAPIFALVLAGCAADVTFQIDVRPNGSALATTREIVDDDLYRLALRQTAMSDPFGVQTMQHEGWSTSMATDANVPVGVQLIGPRGGDSRTLAIAEAIEARLGGFVAPALQPSAP